MIIVVIGQLVILTAAGARAGLAAPVQRRIGRLTAAALAVLAIATFTASALLLAGRLRAEITLGLANLIYVLLLVGGALIIPLSRYPAAIQPVLSALPTAALGEGLRSAALGHPLGWPFLVMIIWLVVAGAAARRSFRWTS